MPEPTRCEELQLVQEETPVENKDRVAPIDDKHVDEKCQDRSAGQARRVRCCSAKLLKSPRTDVRSRDDRESPQRDGDREQTVGALSEPDDLCPGPLGPFPASKERPVPDEYWAPLADLSGSRPAVESLSVTRYSPAEWRLYDNRIFNSARQSVQRERLAALNAHRCMARVFAQTDKDQQDNNVRLCARLGLVGRWKIELQRDIAEFGSEINMMENERKRLSRCLHALRLIESIDKDMKSVRCLRMEHELVRDEVEEELSNELDLCADIGNLYVRLVDHVRAQLRELRDAKQRLEIDLTDKGEAWDIDVHCRALDSKSSTIQWKPGSVQMMADQSTTGSYEKYCKEAIAMSQTALGRSKILRSNLRDAYEKSVGDLRAQANRLDAALARKIDDTVQACRRMENELSQASPSINVLFSNACLRALSDAEILVNEARGATQKLDGAMKCAQTRLDLRNHRCKVENCRDTPQFGLIDEAKTLSEGVSEMLSQLSIAGNSIDDLTKARETLEKHLVMKRKSLWVDRDRCQLLRTFYPTVQILAGH